jgi:hypothetical protein
MELQHGAFVVFVAQAVPSALIPGEHAGRGKDFRGYECAKERRVAAAIFPWSRYKAANFTSTVKGSTYSASAQHLFAPFHGPRYDECGATRLAASWLIIELSLLNSSFFACAMTEHAAGIHC